MSEHIRKLIDAIESGRSVEIEQNFEAAMADKINDAIEARKEQIAANLLSPVPPDSEIEIADVEEDESHGL